jgi:hypothetical protein
MLRIILLVVLLISAGGCETEGIVGSVFFRPEYLIGNRILYAGHLETDPEEDLGLYTVYMPSTKSKRYCYRRGDRDWICPTIGYNYAHAYQIIYGLGTLEIFDAVLLSTRTVVGLGERQYAPAADTTTTTVRFAYMGGSLSDGFNIAVQLDHDGTPLALTSDASSSVSYWTPTWSSDGEWILYSRITGTTGADAQLWRVRPNGTDAEQLSITTTELPTYAFFSPTMTEVFVPGDMTSYNISDGSVGTYDHVRENAAFLAALDAMGYELVRSTLQGALNPGDTVTERQTCAISAIWSYSNRLWFDMLVADASDHEVLGMVLMSWTPSSELLVRHGYPMPISSSRSMEYRFSLIHPLNIP